MRLRTTSLVAAIALCAGSFGVNGAVALEDEGPVARLGFLEGAWEVENVFYTPDGGEQEREPARGLGQFILRDAHFVLTLESEEGEQAIVFSPDYGAETITARVFSNDPGPVIEATGAIEEGVLVLRASLPAGEGSVNLKFTAAPEGDGVVVTTTHIQQGEGEWMQQSKSTWTRASAG